MCKLSEATLGMSVDELESGIVTMKELLPELTETDDDWSESTGGSFRGKSSLKGTPGDKKNTRSALMEEMITSDLYSGQGVHVRFNLLPWARVASAQVNKRREEAERKRSLRLNKEKMNAKSITLEKVGDEMREEEEEEIKPLRYIDAIAKLQEINFTMVSTPLYVLRWRIRPDEVEDGLEGDMTISSSSSTYSGSYVSDHSGLQSVQDSNKKRLEASNFRLKIPKPLTVEEKKGHYIGPVPPMCSGMVTTPVNTTQFSPIDRNNNPMDRSLSFERLGSIQSPGSLDEYSSGEMQNPVRNEDVINQDTFSPKIPYSQVGTSMNEQPTANVENEHFAIFDEDDDADTVPRRINSGIPMEGSYTCVKDFHHRNRDTSVTTLPTTVESLANANTVTNPVTHSRSRSMLSRKASISSSESKRGVTWGRNNHNNLELANLVSQDTSKYAKVAPETGVIKKMKRYSASLERRSGESTAPRESDVFIDDDHDADNSVFSGKHSSQLKRAKSISHNSTGSQCHANSGVTDALRKGITINSKAMETSLKALRRSILIVFIIVGVMNLASLGVSFSLFSQLLNELDNVATNARRAIVMERIYSQIQRLALMSEGHLESADEGETERAEMGVLIEQVAELHQDLYSSINEGNEPERVLYAEPTILIHDLEPGTYVSRMQWNSTTRHVNLMNGVIELIAKARLIQARPYDQNAISEPTGTVFWILENGPTQIRDAMNASMMIAQDNTTWQGQTLVLANHIVLAVALFALIIVTVLVMMPAIGTVLKQKHQVFEVFLNTPVSVLKSLRSQAEAKITALRRAAEEADAGLDIAGAGDADLEDPELSGQDIVEMSGNESDILGSVTRKSRHEIPKLRRSISMKRSRETREGGRLFRRAEGVRLKALASFFWPMVILTVYYITTWWWKWNEAQQSNYGKNEVFQAHQVEFMIGQNYNTRNVLAYCDDQDFVKDQYRRFSILIRELEMRQDALMTGDAYKYHVRPLLKISPSHFHLFMVDGCIPTAKKYISIECYEQFNDGLLGKGLLGAYKQYVQLVTSSMSQRYRQSMRENGETCEPIDMNVGTPHLIEALADTYLSEGFQESANITTFNISHQLNTHLTLNIVVTVVSIFSLSFFYFFVYSPLVQHFDKEIKNVRYLLLLFPDEICRVVPALISIGRELLQGEQSSSGSSVASGERGSGSILRY